MTVADVMCDDELVARYIEWVAVTRRRSPATVKAYSTHLATYLRWLADQGLTLPDVGVEDVERWATAPGRRGGTPAANTVKLKMVSVRRFHEWASERDFPLRRLTTLATPRTPKGLPKPVEDDVWRVLWGSPLCEDDRLWLGLGYLLGLRRMEIVTAEATAPDPSTGLMTFTRKGGNVETIEYIEMVKAIDEELPFLTMGMTDRWLDLLHDTAAFRAERGFPTLWWDVEGEPETDGNRLNKRLDNRLSPQLGLPPGAVTPHRLRHSCATNLLRAGVLPEFVKDALSHASIDVTYRYMRLTGELARWRARERGDPREATHTIKVSA